MQELRRPVGWLAACKEKRLPMRPREALSALVRRGLSLCSEAVARARPAALSAIGRCILRTSALRKRRQSPAPVGQVYNSVFGGKLGDFGRLVQCFFLSFRLGRRSVYVFWLGRCPTTCVPPGASVQCGGRRVAEEATSGARQQRTLLVTPWIPSSFRSITFFLGASSYHEQQQRWQRRLSLRQQRRPPSEGACCFPRIFRSSEK